MYSSDKQDNLKIIQKKIDLIEQVIAEFTSITKH